MDKLIKVLGIVLPVLSVVIGVLGGWVDDKNRDNKITEEVAKRFTEKE